MGIMNEYIVCRFCKIVHIYMFGDSHNFGGCRQCRNKLVPSHIIGKQTKRFLDLLYRKINDTEKRLTKGNT
jgi:hypothetical protein